MKRLRVLVLMHEDLVPPETLEGYSDKEIVEWKTEFDVLTTLRELGHEVRPLGIRSDLGVVHDTIRDWQPQIAVPLVEEFHGVAVYDMHVVSYLEMLRQPYTGCNPRGLMLAHDKALSKKILSFHRIPVPRFSAFPMGRRVRRPKHLRFPLFVKSLIEDGSAGISQASVVRTDEKLEERVAYIHEHLRTDAIAEEYIEGRELYLGILGNRRLTSFPIVELVLSNLPPGTPRIATNRIKWDWAYQDKYGIKSEIVDLPPEVAERVRRVGKRVYRALGLSGYARIDVRLTDAGDVFVLEANPNPDIAYGAEFAEAAEAAGIDHGELLQRILNLGLAYQAEWRRVDPT